MTNPMPFPTSGGAWRYVDGQLVPDVPEGTEQPAAPAPAPRGKRNAPTPSPSTED